MGWRGYFAFCETPSVLRELDQWSRRRLRCIVWKQWKNGPTRFAKLRRCGVGPVLAAKTASSPRGPWRLSNSPALALALSNPVLKSLGLATVAMPKPAYLSNRRIRTRMYGGVGGAEPRGSPPSPLPEPLRIDSISRGVLDPPPSGRTTAETGAPSRTSQ